MDQVDFHQDLMNEFYAYWQKNNIPRKEALEKFSDLHQAAVMLGNLNYQVGNGGFSQWDMNGYSEDIEELLDICDYGIALNLEDFKTLKQLLVKFKEVPEPESDTETYSCQDCGGEGKVEGYDENDEDTEVDCDYCSGSGEIEEEVDNEDEISEKMGALDSPYYAITTIEEQMNTLLLRWDEIDSADVKNYNPYHEGTIKPPCNLKGVDGNVFSVIGHVSATLKKAGLKEQAQEFTETALKQEGYDDVLRLIPKYTEIEWF